MTFYNIKALLALTDLIYRLGVVSHTNLEFLKDELEDFCEDCARHIGICSCTPADDSYHRNYYDTDYDDDVETAWRWEK